MNLTPNDFFELTNNNCSDIFKNSIYVWEGLKNIKSFLDERLFPNTPKLSLTNPVLEKTVILHQGRVIDSDFEINNTGNSKEPYEVKVSGEVLKNATIVFAGAVLMDDKISIGSGSVVESGALIKGPAIIGSHTEIRQGAYIRGDVIIGDKCVLGHTSEIKSSVMLGESKAGHFAYIGDSILGKVNLGAGTKLANLKIVKSPIIITAMGQRHDTGLRKFGAIIGDGVETGCNSVTAPGSIISKNSQIYSNVAFRGFCPPDSIIKLKQNQEIIKKRS